MLGMLIQSVKLDIWIYWPKTFKFYFLHSFHWKYYKKLLAQTKWIRACLFCFCINCVHKWYNYVYFYISFQNYFLWEHVEEVTPPCDLVKIESGKFEVGLLWTQMMKKQNQGPIFIYGLKWRTRSVLCEKMLYLCLSTLRNKLQSLKQWLKRSLFNVPNELYTEPFRN